MPRPSHALPLVGFVTTLILVFLVLGLSRKLATAFVASLETTAPWPPDIELTAVFYDDTPTPVTVSAEWQRFELVVPAWRVLSDTTLWRSMRLEDWNRVPDPLRTHALLALLHRYRPALAGPAAWSSMTALEWDAVPPPVRVMAFLRMIDAHVVRMAPGGAFGRTDREISDTVGAIVMVESWFEHRAVNINASGERDLGLAQASARCRRLLARLHAEGRIAVGAREDDYFDPWNATAVAVFWYLRELHAAGGDEALAIRAYHTGMKAARAGKGMEYLEQVTDKRRQFIRNEQAPPSWRLVFADARFAKPLPSAPALAALTARPLGDARLLAGSPSGTPPAGDAADAVATEAGPPAESLGAMAVSRSR